MSSEKHRFIRTAFVVHTCIRRLAALVTTTILFSLLPSSVVAAVPPLAKTTDDGFAVPQPGRVFEFPRDHASHPEFRIEWWYITGHLFERSTDRRFGFQATFFRSAVEPETASRENRAFGGSQIYLAHMSLLDARTSRFLHEERLNRDGWDASAATDTLDIVNGNWSLRMTDPATETMVVRGSLRGDARFELTLVPEKPKVLFGQDGVSRKGADPTAASHYITFTRLATSGTLRIDGRSLEVAGRAWMDHEISSSQLGEDQVGWDWCAIHLDDGRDVMAYRLRRSDGSSDPFSTVAWVSASGEVRHVPADRFTWEPLEFWTSPDTGGRYPVRYRLRTYSPFDDKETTLEVRALAPHQELTGGLGGIAYWEGACDVFDETGKQIGRAYTELTGYAESLAGKF
jgi:predicted secreted hydrolase